MKNRKNILLDCLHLRNSCTGVDIYSLNLIKNILLIDSTNLYTLLINSRFDKKILNEYLPESSKNYIIKSLWANLPLQVLISSFIIPFYLRLRAIDVYHHHFFFGPWYKWICPKTTIIVTVYDMFHWTIPDITTPRMNWFLKNFADQGMGVADILIAISESTKQDIVKYIYNIKAENVYVTLLGCDLSYIKDAAKLDGLKRFKLNQSNYILYVGSILPKKGIDDLITAYQTAIEHLNVTNLCLILAGKPENSYHSTLSTRIENTPSLKENVKLTGYVTNEELNSLYTNATIFIMPSYYEGFGLPVIEAMSKGCPVIVRNNSSLIEVVGEAGFLFDTVEQLSEQIYRLCNEPELRKILSDAGTVQARKFTWERTAQQTIEIYNKTDT